MKRYFLDLLVAIPLAVGLVLTVLAVANAIDSAGDSEKGVTALILGVMGIPLLFASTAAIARRSTRRSLDT